MLSRALKSFARIESALTFRESVSSLMFLTTVSSLFIRWLYTVIQGQHLPSLSVTKIWKNFHHSCIR